METVPIKLDVRDGVATVTLARPERLNAFDPQLGEALLAALGEARSNAAVRALVLRGEGRSFMAGGDVATFRAPDAPARIGALIDLFHAAVRAIAAAPAPVISAVHGPVAGGGISLALSADFVIAADDARFVPAYGALGTSPDGGLTYTLTRLVGPRRAAEILMLGDELSASAAAALGLVNRVVSRAELDDAAQALARRLAAGAPRALASVKELVRLAAAGALDTQLDAERARFVAAAGSADFREGVAAFLERRSPMFLGQ